MLDSLFPQVRDRRVNPQPSCNQWLRTNPLEQARHKRQQNPGGTHQDVPCTLYLVHAPSKYSPFNRHMESTPVRPGDAGGMRDSANRVGVPGRSAWGKRVSLTRAVGDSGQSTGRLCHFRLIPVLGLISILTPPGPAFQHATDCTQFPFSKPHLRQIR